MNDVRQKLDSSKLLVLTDKLAFELSLYNLNIASYVRPSTVRSYNECLRLVGHVVCVALFPGLPRFYLPFTIIHASGRAVKTGKAWTQGRCREGAIFKIQTSMKPPQGATIQEGRHSGLDTHGGRQLAEGSAGRKGIFPKTYVMASVCVCACAWHVLFISISSLEFPLFYRC